MKQISVIGVQMDLGAGRRGVDMGPSAIRYANLRERITQLGYAMVDLGNIETLMFEQIAPPASNEKLRYLQPICDVNQRLAQRVFAEVEQGHFPLTLGGDHSIAIGSINGVGAHRRTGVIWIDAHGDFNTDQTSPSGNIHGMCLAALTGRGDQRLTHVLRDQPILQDHDVVLVDTRDLDEYERRALKDSHVHVFTMHEIDRRGMADIMQEAIGLATANTQQLHISFDMDVLDPNEAPGVGTPVAGGISYREAHLAMELIYASRRMTSLDIVEVNPILDSNNKTAKLAVELICSALGQRIY